ncbi:hypothetical protein PAECIP111892_04155 [Paenibacillus auburnensis]|jgi:hypothetical protein|uniref:DUF5709 domain-containing protein n=1 Tax=Paenibacillus auburnensis TaxID=2905649 RepID=A0ABM9CLD3_9BACL|nr:hypothetical protein [Paenibacillus auburnensis]CAH1215676.1 hypothetical protein PAECIP111892_04155 [Paenibacillus auburnensis]
MGNEFNKTEADLAYERYQKMGSITSEEDFPPEELRLPGTHEAPVDYVDGVVDEGSDPVLEGDPILAADIGLNTPETTLGPRADRNGRIAATPAPERDELLESDAIFAAGAAGLTGSVIDYADDEDVPADNLTDDEEDLPLEDIPDADELQPGTAVDPAAPPLDVMPGTDVLNGSTGEED